MGGRFFAIGWERRLSVPRIHDSVPGVALPGLESCVLD
jgi:hypothetical protein